jgi:hypothetical protein
MRHWLTWIVLPALPLALLCACPPADSGEDPPAIETLFPKNSEVGTWIEDTSKGTAGVQVSNSAAEAQADVDGDADSFENDMVAFAREFYTNTTHTMELRVWQLKDASACTRIYDDLVVNDPLYTSNTWTAATLGDAGRVADTGTQWWHNARKKAYHIEAKTQANDADGKSAAEAMITAVTDKIP